MLVPDVLNIGALDDGREGCIRSIWRQAGRYHFASLQDRNPVVAVRHNGYAVALIDILHDIATEDEVKAVTGESLMQKRKEIIAVQDKLETRRMKLLEELAKRGMVVDF